ncbi:unnamed protein product [Cuscuta campestris]|uniref:Uncharacterized protein n=1 Tax=Cuscuta campestris TaxID=132261 RepID=A0A484LUY8_9ASTE|nr:unnamed protein product [Cuscuta campestris]
MYMYVYKKPSTQPNMSKAHLISRPIPSYFVDNQREAEKLETKPTAETESERECRLLRTPPVERRRRFCRQTLLHPLGVP